MCRYTHRVTPVCFFFPHTNQWSQTGISWSHKLKCKDAETHGENNFPTQQSHCPPPENVCNISEFNIFVFKPADLKTLTWLAGVSGPFRLPQWSVLMRSSCLLLHHSSFFLFLSCTQFASRDDYKNKNRRATCILALLLFIELSCADCTLLTENWQVPVRPTIPVNPFNAEVGT